MREGGLTARMRILQLPAYYAWDKSRYTEVIVIPSVDSEAKRIAKEIPMASNGINPIAPTTEKTYAASDK